MNLEKQEKIRLHTEDVGKKTVRTQLNYVSVKECVAVKKPLLRKENRQKELSLTECVEDYLDCEVQKM